MNVNVQIKSHTVQLVFILHVTSCLRKEMNKNGEDEEHLSEVKIPEPVFMLCNYCCVLCVMCFSLCF